VVWLQLDKLEKIENSRTPQPLEEIKKLRDKPDIEAKIAELVCCPPASEQCIVLSGPVTISGSVCSAP
jgi:hypothetical protein